VHDDPFNKKPLSNSHARVPWLNPRMTVQPESLTTVEGQRTGTARQRAIDPWTSAAKVTEAGVFRAVNRAGEAQRAGKMSSFVSGSSSLAAFQFDQRSRSEAYALHCLLITREASAPPALHGRPAFT
jgi:hypothetical protein